MSAIQVLNPDTNLWEWADTSDLPALQEAWERSDAQTGVYQTPEPFVPPSVQKELDRQEVLDKIKKATPILLIALVVLWGMR